MSKNSNVTSIIKKNARNIGALITIGVSAFLSVCLWTFHVTDRCSFYISTESDLIRNKAGVCGAYVAGFFYYLFGCTSLLLVPWLLFLSYILVRKKYFAYEWERLVAGFLFICLTATLFHIYAVDMVGIMPGGYIGLHMTQFFSTFLDRFNLKLFVYTMLFASLIITLRFSFMRVVRVLVNLGAFLCSQRFLQPAYRVCSYVAWVISRPFKYVYSFVHQLWSPETIHNKDCSILEFERGIELGQLQDDDFWQSYVHQNEQLSEEEDLELIEEYACSSRMVDGADVWSAFEDGEGSIENNDDEDDDFFGEDDYEQLQEDHFVDAHKQSRGERSQDSRKQNYALPSLDIFIGNQEERDDPKVMQYLQERAQILQQKLERFGVSGTVVSIKRGPVVTMFEYQPEIDCKISKITALEDDLALALQALSIRIIAPIPGKSLVGFEVSNKHRKSVYFAEVVKSPSYVQFDGALPLVLGQDTVGNNIVVDLVRMPHLLIAGSTGSGKSVALNAMLISLLCKLSPDQLRLVLIDPKRLEFASFADIAHLLFPIVTHPKKAAPVLKWVVKEMEDRYEKMATEGGRNIHDYNIIMEKEGREQLPYIVVVIDELADLMMTAGKEIEDLIARIAQMARAAGIHLMVATQRPSVDVITGLIKVNFPSRISFRVTSKVDSRTILDGVGADKLLGQGDMLFLDAHGAGLCRLHGAYVSDKEIDTVVNHIKQQREVEYLDLNDHLEQLELDEDRDDIYTDVLVYLQEVDEVSISLLQRKFKIGYNRSARIIDMLEAEGFISPAGSGKTRSVIRS